MRVHSSPASVVKGLSLIQSLILAAMAVLLLVADVLPENHYVDPDHLEFWLALGFGISAIAVAARDRGLSIDVAAWRNRAILLTITLAICAVAGEFATRLIFRDVTTSSDNGGYFSRRWHRGGAVTLNGLGFRGRAFDAVKPPGVYRIAVVGDSFTFGNGVRQEDRYTELLQASLPSHFEVLNFGAPGANTPEHRTRVETVLRDVHPDFILVQWYVNDVEDDDSAGRPSFLPLMPIRWLHDWLNDASALYTVANMQWAETQVAFGMSRSYTDYLQARLGNPQSPDSVRDRELLRDLITKSQRAGVPIGVVLFPDTAGDLAGHYPFQYLHDRVTEVCAERKITCLDLRVPFSRVKDRQSLWANRLDHHPGVAANQIAAEKILETYASAWVSQK